MALKGRDRSVEAPEVRTSERRDRWWQVGVWIVLVAGVSTSLVASRAWHANLEAQDRAAFRMQASDLAAVVGSGLSRDTDFTASLRSLVATSPQLTNTEFARYLTGVGASARYPGGIGYGYYEKVPAAKLAAFEATIVADPPAGESVTGYQVIPPGARASYCLGRFVSERSRATQISYPIGLDVCAPGTSFGASNLDGASAQFTVNVVAPGVIAVGAPVYAAGIVPATAAGRRAAFAGWIGVTLAASGLLPSAADRGMQVSILHRNEGATPILLATSGAAPRGHLLSQSLAVDADGQWTVVVRGVAPHAGSAWVVPVLALVAGLLLTGMLFGFVQILARSRRRALRLVAERTRELHHQALHDSLTGLANRALILDRTEQMLARGRREHIPTAALFLDLDGFKDVNDTYGHATGDRLLEAVAQRITETLHDQSIAGRLGGDEFVVLVEGAESGPEVVAERLLAVVREPFALEAAGVSVSIQASIGIAAGDRADAGDLLRDADVALYQAKGAGGDRYALFDPGMQTAARDRLELAAELRGALGAGELFLAYQPTFSLRDMTVTGVEALIRWRHPGRGIVAPDSFIPIAEDTGLIVPIGRWVLQTACAAAAGWQSPDRRLSVAVNVSGRQLDTDGLIDDVSAALADSGLDPGLLTLEVTETALMKDPAGAIERLRALKALGVRIAIDDFGTGYCSLTYLRQFPVDALKIDRSFVSAMADSPESAVIVRTLVQLGKALGIETLAEGIEERTQLEHLQLQDCDSGQGFFFARPLTPEALQTLLDPAEIATAPAV